MTDQVFGPGEDDAAREALREHDTRVLFDGRTILIECVFHTIVDPVILSTRLREACSGPLLRLNAGTIERRTKDMAIKTKSFINTDEAVVDVATRVNAMSPKPSKVTGGIVDTREAAKIWGELNRVRDGGD